MSQINNRQRNNVAQNEDLKQKFLCFEFRSWYTSKTQLFLKWELLWSWSFWWVFNILKSDPVAAAIIGARQRWSKQKKTISGFNWKATHNCESHMATRAEKRQPIVGWIWNQPILHFSALRAIIFSNKGKMASFATSYISPSTSLFPRTLHSVYTWPLFYFQTCVNHRICRKCPNLILCVAELLQANPLVFGCIPHPPVLVLQRQTY